MVNATADAKLVNARSCLALLRKMATCSPAMSAAHYNAADHRKHSLTGSIHCPRSFAGLPVQYKQFTISVHEIEPGKWRARVRRTSGRPLIGGRAKLLEFVTALDGSSEVDAMTMAIEAIDAGAFSRATQRHSEKFWRRTIERKNHQH